MYTIQFKCPELTGDEIITKEINDSSLEDTWDSLKFGEVPADLKAIGCEVTHDINVWFDTNDEGRDELHATIYLLDVNLYDPEHARVRTDLDGHKCEIISVKSPKFEVPEGVKHVGGDRGTDEFINDGEDYFYFNESFDKVECPQCERSIYLDDLVSDENGKITCCCECEGE